MKKRLRHFYESDSHRRARLGGNPSGQSMCGCGEAMAYTTRDQERVTCPECLKLLKKFPQAY